MWLIQDVEIDVYLFPTRMDTTPLSLREAELMRNPVVATNVAGIPEAIIDGVTGFLVEAGNHEQYIEKLKLLLDDKELRKQMGEAGRKFVEKKFNQEASVKGFLDVIRLYVTLQIDFIPNIVNVAQNKTK